MRPASSAAGWRERSRVAAGRSAVSFATRTGPIIWRTPGLELAQGDVLDPASLRGAGEGVEVAYYLVHSMGRGGGGDFEERDRRAAENFARIASEEGISRVVYLGGLGDDPKSPHLASRQRTAEILADQGPP